MIDHSAQHAATNPPAHAKWARPAVQAGFLFLSLLMGLQFRNFVNSLSGPLDEPVAYRPAGVEAYLPISSLMSLTYLAKTGIANRVHPAGLVLFMLILALTLLIGRGFCSWVCPIGTLAEYAHRIGRRALGRNLWMPWWLDIPLRGIKYVVLAFFIYFIFRMSADGLRHFIYGPYNRIADVKMYLFFANISRTTLATLITLGILSIIFQNFWCRYLCPYGALLCLCSAPSPLAIRRAEEKCIACGKCARACPNRVPVDAKRRVGSTECTMCFSCVEVCPVPGALRAAGRVEGSAIPVTVYGAVIVAAFLLTPHVARVFNYWDTETPAFLYKHLYQRIARIDHPRPRRFQASPPEDESDPGEANQAQGEDK
ncbi:MAG: 4Fe-4S binding protein [Planctomycetota bacterium]